jgi:hypothetical protein
MASYVKGNILLVHLELSKTPEAMEKQRKFWNRLAEFLGYSHGNVVVKLFRPVRIGVSDREIVVVPIYFTKFVAYDVKSIPTEIKNNYKVNVVQSELIEEEMP